MEMESLQAALRATDHEDALTALAATAQVSGELERLASILVRRARQQGATWTRIADVLGVSKQAVHKKYGGPRLFGGPS